MSLGAPLLQQPQRFDFVQVIRLLRSAAQTRELRFCAEPMPIGAPREVQAIERLGSQTRVRLGLEALSGAKGVLPDYFYEELLHSLHAEDRALNDFLDIFNHRYYQLLQGSLEKGSLLLRDEQEVMDRSIQTRMPQRQCLGRLAALPEIAEGNSDLLRYSVLLGLKVRSLTGLCQLLCDYFELPIKVEAVAQSRYRLPVSSLTRLSALKGQNNRLGQGGLLGRTGSLHYHRLEIKVEPRDHREYVRLQSDTGFSQKLRRLAQAYLRESTDLKLYLHVKRAFLSQPLLSSQSKEAVRLGEANCLAPQIKPEEYRKILLQ